MLHCVAPRRLVRCVERIGRMSRHQCFGRSQEDDSRCHRARRYPRVIRGCAPRTHLILGFDYHLEALNAHGKPNELNEAFYQLRHCRFIACSWTICHSWTSSYVLLAFSVVYHWTTTDVCLVKPDRRARAVRRAQATMRRIGMELIQDRKAAVLREVMGKRGTIDKKDLPGKDLLTLLIKANMATDIPEHKRLSDEEVLSRRSLPFPVCYLPLSSQRAMSSQTCCSPLWLLANCLTWKQDPGQGCRTLEGDYPQHS